MNNHFKIIIPLYNVEKYIKLCIRSVKAQTYDNFQCIILDDMSTDDSAAVIRREIGNDDRFKLIVNTEKAYALKNIYDGINISNPSAEDIILTLDGDDWLASRDVLEKVNNVYKQSGCWLTYGSYAEYPSNRRGKFARQIPLSVINSNSFRNHEWCSSHMRTFKYHLWRQIKKEDLLDSEGKFYSMTWDLAFMFPMLEMAGHRSQYIQDILYVYNVANPLNDHKIDNSYQIKLEREIRQKEKYHTIIDEDQNFFRWNRFDLPIKKMFLKFYDKGFNSDFGEKIYKEHLKIWNNFKEYNNPNKNTYESFRMEFIKIYEDICAGNFDWSLSPITIDQEGYLLNGAHRTAASNYAGITPKSKKGTNFVDGQKNCDFKMFKNLGLSENYLDAAALEMAKNNNKLVLAHIFPAAVGKMENVEKIILQHANIAYKKEIHLNKNGPLNYMLQLYRGESWAGNWSNNFAGFREKASLCFTADTPMTVYLLEPHNATSAVSLKKEVRDIYKIGNHSIHVNDTHEETIRLSRCLFNKNSVHFLNNARLKNYQNFFKWVQDYEKYLANNNLDAEDYCITASGVLSLYGLREASDLDYLHTTPALIRDPGDNIHSHNEYGKSRYRKNIDEIVQDPENHFYFGNIKVASLEIVRQLKEDRNEPKDQKDIQLIMEVL